MPTALSARAATVDDIPAIDALMTDAFGPGEQQVVRACLHGPGSDVSRWAVVGDPDQPAGKDVVSACVLLPFPLSIAGVAVPAGQIEFVATHADYRRRGLVRALMDWHHERSAEQGQLVQLISGIPYLYRRFGYGWGLSSPHEYAIDRSTLEMPAGLGMRPARAIDLDALVALEAQRPINEVRTIRDRTRFLRWLWISDLPGEPASGADRLFVVERGGEVVGWASYTVRLDEKRLYLLPAMAADDEAADAILAHAFTQAEATGTTVSAYDVAGTRFGARLRAVGQVVSATYGIYARVPEPLRLLTYLSPLLSARLGASPLAHASGAATLSLYNDAIRFHYDHGQVHVERVAPIEDPLAEGASGVAPDWFPALVLGRFGAAALEDLVDDVGFGDQRELFAVLFPRLDADVLGDF